MLSAVIVSQETPGGAERLARSLPGIDWVRLSACGDVQAQEPTKTSDTSRG